MSLVQNVGQATPTPAPETIRTAVDAKFPGRAVHAVRAANGDLVAAGSDRDSTVAGFKGALLNPAAVNDDTYLAAIRSIQG